MPRGPEPQRTQSAVGKMSTCDAHTATRVARSCGSPQGTPTQPLAQGGLPPGPWSLSSVRNHKWHRLEEERWGSSRKETGLTASNTYMHTHTHTHTCKSMCTSRHHAHKYARTHICTHKYSGRNAHVCMQDRSVHHAHTCMLTHACTCVHTHTKAQDTHVHTHKQIPSTQTHTHTCTHTHAHRHRSTRTRTRMYVRTNTQSIHLACGDAHVKMGLRRSRHVHVHADAPAHVQTHTPNGKVPLCPSPRPELPSAPGAREHHPGEKIPRVSALRLQINKTKTETPTRQHHLVAAAGPGGRQEASFLGGGFSPEPGSLGGLTPAVSCGGWGGGALSTLSFVMLWFGPASPPLPHCPWLAPSGPEVTWALSLALLGILGSLLILWASCLSVKWGHYIDVLEPPPLP